MADPMQQITDMFKKFGTDMKLPGVDMDAFLAHHRKNLEAMSATAKVAAEGATTVAGKQREILEKALADLTEHAKSFKIGGNPQEMMAAQADFAKKGFEAVIKNTKDIAELVQKSNTEALSIVQGRMQDSIKEIQSAFTKK
jgi:phasin family protein